MMKSSMLDVITPKVATSSAAVALSEAFMASGPSAHATAVERTTGAAAAACSKSTEGAATRGAHCFRTPSRCNEEQGGEGNDGEPTR
jgi:thiamine biosynthesis lipoprotein ApbE